MPKTDFVLQNLGFKNLANVMNINFNVLCTKYKMNSCMKVSSYSQ